MQTFLPLPDFAGSAAVLDDRRLGKQRVETFQVLRALTWPSYGWKHHPAVRMWRGFSWALVSYGDAVCGEWEARGYADAVRAQLRAFGPDRLPDWPELRDRGLLPPWVGSDAVHVSHQSALVRKDPATYRALFPGVPDDLPYTWPAPVFPRWPVRRGDRGALSLPAALSELGLTEARPEQRDAVAALSALSGRRKVTVRLPPGRGARTTALLAALCTPGTTVWLLPGAIPRPSATPPRAERPSGRRGGGATAASIAREPSPDDVRAMAQEASSEPEFRFVRPPQLDAVLEELGDHVGLVVVDIGVEEPATRPVRTLVLRRSEPSSG